MGSRDLLRSRDGLEGVVEGMEGWESGRRKQGDERERDKEERSRYGGCARVKVFFGSTNDGD